MTKTQKRAIRKSARHLLGHHRRWEEQALDPLHITIMDAARNVLRARPLTKMAVALAKAGYKSTSIAKLFDEPRQRVAGWLAAETKRRAGGVCDLQRGQDAQAGLRHGRALPLSAR